MNCDYTKLKRSSEILVSVSERYRWAVVGKPNLGEPDLTLANFGAAFSTALIVIEKFQSLRKLGIFIICSLKQLSY